MNAPGSEPEVIARLRADAGAEGIRGTHLLSQQRIDAFADATGDHNWIHVDAARAARESPLGRTIAHGFLLLSLTVADDVERWQSVPGIASLVNYGLDKVRFLAPVASGEQVQVRSRLRSLVQRVPGQWLLAQDKVVETADGRPVLVAEHLALVLLADVDRRELP